MRAFPIVFALASLASSLAACSFRMEAGTGAKSPPTPNNAPPPSAPAPAATPAPAPTSSAPKAPLKRLGKRPSPTPTSTATQPAQPATNLPTGAAVATAATPFGGGTADPSGFKGNVYWVDKNTTKIPSLASMTPAGFVFTKQLDVAPQAFTGFPGIDAARKEYFAIRYEAPLLVATEADYDFRVVSDDAAILLIDNTLIVDNDGARQTVAEQSGPVHLVPGTHLLTVDYLQTNGNVALQVFCKKAGEAEKICPTQL